jgi:hypothetical protein
VSIPRELAPLIAQYRAGLEAELTMLRRLASLALTERQVTSEGAYRSLDEISDARDRAMASLVAVESELKPVRRALVAARDRLIDTPEFQELAALHKDAAALAAEIVATDDQSLQSLREAELARKFAAESLEKGETMLAGYRRVVTPSLENATLVNRRG